MTGIDVDALVEEAAKAAYEALGIAGKLAPWDGILPEVQDKWRRTFRPTVELVAARVEQERLGAFRSWLKDNIWAPNDMGGFLQIGTAYSDAQAEAIMERNVAELFDVIDPDWHSYTNEARGGSGA